MMYFGMGINLMIIYISILNVNRKSRLQAGPTSQQQQQRNYHPAADHQRYSYAGYEPEREFKDYTREREHMLRQRNNNQRPVEYTARYVL